MLILYHHFHSQWRTNCLNCTDHNCIFRIYWIWSISLDNFCMELRLDKPEPLLLLPCWYFSLDFEWFLRCLVIQIISYVAYIFTLVTFPFQCWTLFVDMLFSTPLARLKTAAFVSCSIVTETGFWTACVGLYRKLIKWLVSIFSFSKFPI